MNDSYENNNIPQQEPYPVNGYYEPPRPAEPQSSGMNSRKIIALAVGCSLLGGIFGAGAMSLLGRNHTISNIYEGERTPTVLNVHNVDTSKALTLAELYAINVNSTVGITTAVTTNYWGFQTTRAASGSGFIFSDDGYILTNHHVISGASSVTVTMYDGTKYDAMIVGSDESNDIAVLKIEAENLTPVILGNSDTVNVGDTVVAIGNPLGELTFSLTSGVVSALNREVTFSGGISMDLIQTDAAINSGNSGGALFNLYGEVVGITNAKYSSNSSGQASIDNIGFAIPMNSVRSIVESIIENGYIAKPYIGITVSTVTEEIMAYGLPAGASVQAVEENSPAAKAGLQTNDIITKVGDTDITTHSELIDIIGSTTPDDVVTLTVYRNGSYITIDVTIGEKITETFAQPAAQQTPKQSENNLFPFGFFNR